MASTTELDRLASLREYQILGTESEPIFDNLAQLAACICQTPVAAISLIDGQRIWYKAIIGWQIQEIPREEAICPLCLETPDVVMIPDTLADERTKNLPLVTSNPKIRFYGAIPLIGADGFTLGALCVVDYQPRRLSDRQITSLKILADQVIETLELRRQMAFLRGLSANNESQVQENSEIQLISRSAIEAMPQGAIFLSTQGVICNSKAERILGRWGEEAQTYLLLEPCWQAISENSTPFTIDTHPAWIALTTGKPITQVVMGIPKPDGNLCWVKLDTHPLLVGNSLNQTKAYTTLNPQSNAVLCSFTEIAAPKPLINDDPELLSLSSDLLSIFTRGGEVKDSRLLQASLQELDNINLALDRAAIVMIIDANHLIKHANQKLCQLSLFSLEELVGKPLSFLDSGEHSEVFLPQLWQTLSQSEIWRGEIKCKSQDSSYFWVDMTIVPLIDSQGKLIHYVAIGNDITDKKQLEKQFLHAQRLESIGTLAGGISHDLNNILTPILAASQLLQLKFPQADSRTKQLLKTLEINSKRGASLVKQVLSFARGLEGIKTALTVKHILTEVQQIISQTFPKNIEIIAEISTDLWMVLGDPTQIHQVLMNLTVNARDAMIDGGILTISAENITLDPDYTRLNIDAKVGSYISISVMDTGIGIPTEIIDRIFDPFFTTKDIGQGTGLGLATVLTIIKSHNGFIKVDSKLGKGSLFQIYLPAIIHLENQVVIEPELPLGKGELILVVDDENLILETTKTILETYNYRVLVASDGIDAIALYAQRKHDISAVIVDLMMPVMDGAQTTRILRRLNPLVKIITISGLEGSSYPYNINSLERFIPKPYTPRDLLETLSKVLHKN
ncbi:hybrid sensor histidine kinase/response regulator [Merismopedia glauca]|uniref:hybrid sensor histidine kinase/response regulator n=1 Tax=Merismopedia glauca TaxID=292586 RepID=UPI0015E7132E|nr:ATP-binding protein [Merismopedia glauca]